MNKRSHCNYVNLFVVAIAIVIAVAKTMIVLKGGAFYSPDETRYLRSLQFAASLARLDVGTALDLLVQHPEHSIYAVVVLPAALAHGFLGVDQHWLVPALWNAAASTMLSLLVFRIVFKQTKSVLSGLIGMTAVGLAPSMCYYARFCLPYDLALLSLFFACMLLVWAPMTRINMLLGGFLTSVAILSYNGYWYIAIMMAIIVAYRLRPINGHLHHYAHALVGALTVPAFMAWWASIRDVDVLERMRQFSSAITDGDYGDGWRVVFAYLWESDGLLIVAMILLSLTGLVVSLRRGEIDLAVRFHAPWIVLYMTMVAASDITHHFVMYGRTARLLLPFLVVSACVGGHALFGGRKIVMSAVLTFILLSNGINLIPIYRMVFPLPVLTDAINRFGDELSVSYSVEGPPDHAEAHRLGANRYVLINYRHFCKVAGLKEIPRGNILESYDHPMSYRPNWYDGANREQRAILEEADLRILLIDTGTESYIQ